MERRPTMEVGWLALVVVAVAGVVLTTRVALPVQRLASDALLRLSAARPPPPPAGLPDVAIVALDPQSLRAFPSWPWPRSLHARAVRQLARAGAKAIAIDIDFSTPRDSEEDTALARALAEAGNAVLAVFRQVQELPGGGALEIANLPVRGLRQGSASVGSVLMPVDDDGVVRRAPHGSAIAGEPTASLASAALALATRAEPTAPRQDTFPLDYRRAAPAVPILSIVDVVEGRFDPRDVAGRVVFVGATASELQDLWTTPLGPARPGVWIQAIAYRTLAAAGAGESVLSRPSLFAELALALVLSLAAASLGRRSHARRLLALTLLAAGLAAACTLALIQRGLLLDPVVPAGVLAAHYVLGLEGVRRRFGRRLTEREHSLDALHRVGATTAGARGRDALGIALSLLGEVVDASGLALFRADGEALDGRRIEWSRRGGNAVGDLAAAERARRDRTLRLYEGNAPGESGAGLALYLPLFGGEGAVGVLVVEREAAAPLDELQMRTIATVGAQLTLSLENLRLLDDLRVTFESSIEAIASAVEARDGYTELHCRRLACFSARMAERLGLDGQEIESIRLGALLHDVGKIGVRDEVLLKTGGYSAQETAAMERHTEVGQRIATSIHGLSESTLACIRFHHEHWDGSGYPMGLRGEEIPLPARIVAVVDVWDALSTARPYKPAYGQAQVRAMLRKGRGSHFEPELVDLFLQILDEEGEEMLGLARTHAAELG